jgi:hypothetical protein
MPRMNENARSLSIIHGADALLEQVDGTVVAVLIDLRLRVNHAVARR